MDVHFAGIVRCMELAVPVLPRINLASSTIVWTQVFAAFLGTMGLESYAKALAAFGYVLVLPCAHFSILK